VTVEIPLTRGLVALVDDDDAHEMLKSRWYPLTTKGKVYAIRRWHVGAPADFERLMHRAILKPRKGLLIDHTNGMTLDNRRSNIRIATPSQNTVNQDTSKKGERKYPRGVHKTERGRFYATITQNRERIRIGGYDTPEEAHAAYCEEARRIFGEFARYE
jgi:hypothetical protein